MLKLGRTLALATMLFAPALATAGGIDSLAVPCPASPNGFVTRSQAESGLRAFAGCRQVFDDVDRAAPVCNPDHTACMCRNEGTVQDFLDCSWPLVNHCEANAGCLWVQYPSGDVVCYCNVPYE